MQLSMDFIEKTLDIYNPEFIAIKKARYEGWSLTATVGGIPYPFTRGGCVQYMTASMAMLYLSQAGYLLLRSIACHVEHMEQAELDDTIFFMARNSLRIVTSKVTISFRSKIPDGDPFALNIFVDKPRMVKGYLRMNFRGDMDNKKCLFSGLMSCFVA